MSAIFRTLSTAVAIASYSAAGLLLAAAFLGALNVAGYNLLAKGIPSANQLSAAALAAAFFLGLPLVQKSRSHIGVDLVTSRLPSYLQRSLDRFSALLTSTVLGLIAWTAFVALERSMAMTELSMGSWPFPIWPFRVAAVAGAALAALVGLSQIFAPGKTHD